MAKIGPFVTIPTGAYCNITLDSGEKIVVNYEEGGHGREASPRLTVDRIKMMGFSSERVFELDLATATGAATLAALTEAGTSGSALRRFVAHVQECRSVAELVAHCRRPLSTG
jgi:hypothetical protein